MLEEQIAEALALTGHQWKTSKGYISPTAEDIKIVLDNAAKELYDREAWTRLETGGLIIDKDADGSFRVSVYLGSYI